jgi:hypothetical protein
MTVDTYGSWRLPSDDQPHVAGFEQAIINGTDKQHSAAVGE